MLALRPLAALTAVAVTAAAETPRALGLMTSLRLSAARAATTSKTDSMLPNERLDSRARVREVERRLWWR